MSPLRGLFSNDCYFYKDSAATQLLSLQRSCHIFVE